MCFVALGFKRTSFSSPASFTFSGLINEVLFFSWVFFLANYFWAMSSES